jgi:hypothetical protein
LCCGSEPATSTRRLSWRKRPRLLPDEQSAHVSRQNTRSRQRRSSLNRCLSRNLRRSRSTLRGPAPSTTLPVVGACPGARSRFR